CPDPDRIPIRGADHRRPVLRGMGGERLALHHLRPPDTGRDLPGAVEPTIVVESDYKPAWRGRRSPGVSRRTEDPRSPGDEVRRCGHGTDHRDPDHRLAP